MFYFLADVEIDHFDPRMSLKGEREKNHHASVSLNYR